MSDEAHSHPFTTPGGIRREAMAHVVSWLTDQELDQVLDRLTDAEVPAIAHEAELDGYLVAAIEDELEERGT